LRRARGHAFFDYKERRSGVNVLYKLALSGLILTGQVWGKHWHEDQDDWKWHWQHDLDDDVNHRHAKGCYFEPHDLRVISAYYAQRHAPSSVVDKKIHRNGQLPHGWETRMQLLPAQVERLLVPLPDGYRRGIINGFAIVYSLQSGVIIDAIALSGG
jgi:hypothetical protein